MYIVAETCITSNKSLVFIIYTYYTLYNTDGGASTIVKLFILLLKLIEC